MYKLLPILLFAYSVAVTTDDIYDNSYALIIGIDNYQNIQPLNFAVKDAFAIANLLINSFGFPEENISILLDEEATKDNIKGAFLEISQKADKNDRVLIYFSGHGETLDLPGGGEMGYLLTVEAERDIDAERGNLHLSSVVMDELGYIGLLSNAKHILFLINAAYGGLPSLGPREFINNKADFNNDELTQNYIHKITNEMSRQIITAGGRGEVVIEKDEWQYSAFTKYLLKGLESSDADFNHDNIITADELGTYLRKFVTEDSDFQQTPQKGRFKSSGSGEFIFIKNTDETNIVDIQSKYQKEQQTEQMEQLTHLLLEQVKNQKQQELYEIILGNLDSVMQSSNYDSLLSIMSNKQLITLLELSTEQKKNLFANSKVKELFKQQGDYYDDSFAVIIGINEYSKSKPLKYAVNDAMEIKKMLTSKFGFMNKNIRLLIDNEATYSRIREALYEIGEQAKENDRILIYFAGHGTQITTPSGLDIGYLIPFEGNINKPLLGGIPMDDFFRMCQFSKSKHMLFLMDACYSGLMAEASRGLDRLEEDEGYISTVANIPARQIITAGNGKQEVWERDEWQHSAFTLNLLKALDYWEADGYKDGYITATELGEYLKKTVADETQGKQTPQSERIKSSKGGEFVFYHTP